MVPIQERFMPKRLPMRVMPPASLDAPQDPTALGPLPIVPLVPYDILQRHKAFIPTDNRFRAAARTLRTNSMRSRQRPG